MLQRCIFAFSGAIVVEVIGSAVIGMSNIVLMQSYFVNFTKCILCLFDS
jgi:hypothetical protein